MNDFNAIRAVASAITASDAMPGRDNHGGHIASLTEAVMSVGRSLDAIASALQAIADAIVEAKS